ncbi:hypothetical protein DPMN_079398 [Dreissena polymorpha]|uniref:Uncharacterized protein n=1 Tax=Dreissena polymorpha TaxID=45954 RepID=A0A9D4BSY6_DREPO|nr:hypothetical protein DPMN_079398 [Dreissena polymorpha]
MSQLILGTDGFIPLERTKSTADTSHGKCNIHCDISSSTQEHHSHIRWNTDDFYQ